MEQVLVLPSAVAAALGRPASTVTRLLQRRPDLASARTHDGRPVLTPDDAQRVASELGEPEPQLHDMKSVTLEEIAREFGAKLEDVCRFAWSWMRISGSEVNAHVAARLRENLHLYGAGRDMFPRARCNRPAEEQERDARAEQAASKTALARQQAFVREHGYFEGDEVGKRRVEEQKRMTAKKDLPVGVRGLKGRA